ncbi:DUF6286 domain-containing protein [Arthrobacter sp. GMC3]|uniref:DUF6286 domain-containing protein n=1 Tax=Arthrobacter sp. GMC3 TaxID=2058894 RepID=UPI000CE3F2F6|nr:DUF6286 domain-containing protein [Arthrobacter sp. GMC3]
MSDVTRVILKRESRSSRAVISVVAAILVALLALYGLLEAMLRVLGQPPWLIDPLTAAQRLAQLPEGILPAMPVAIGLLIFIVGLVFLANAVIPGRRARHVIPDPRVAVVVDDVVVASALAKRARLAAGVTREQVVVVVSAKSVQVNVRPTSGILLDEALIQAAVEDELTAMALQPAPAVKVHLANSGVIGV